MSKVFVKTVHDHVQHIQLLLQLPDPVFPLSLHDVQQGRDAGSSHNGPVWIFIPSLIPELRRSVVGGQEIHGDPVVMSNVGRGVVQVFFDVVGSVYLMGEGRDKRGGSSVKRHSVKRLFVRGEDVVGWWEWKRDDGREKTKEIPQTKYDQIDGTPKGKRQYGIIHYYPRKDKQTLSPNRSHHSWEKSPSSFYYYHETWEIPFDQEKSPSPFYCFHKTWEIPIVLLLTHSPLCP
jgi:hypothetical protein